MGLPKHYRPQEFEPRLQAMWQERSVYHFEPGADSAVFAIDTPPPTVSGNLHLGHVFSYTHTDIIARFKRMRGFRTFYPMGYDDNGLPTERLVERTLGINAAQVGRQAFIAKCLEFSQQVEKEYRSLWLRLGLSVDWRLSYRTIDSNSRTVSQWSFLELYTKGKIYRRQAPTIWCSECHTAIAQADVDDLDRTGELYTIAFRLANGETLPIATTRPELLPACVSIFVNPEDDRFSHLVGTFATVPLFSQSVPILSDPAADPQFGTGAVMCCTFGDQTDVAWWFTHRLPLRLAIGIDGRLNENAGSYHGLSIQEGRQVIQDALDAQDALLDRHNIEQSIRVHERCDTPVEYIPTLQWFIRILDYKDRLLAAGDEIKWHPEHMRARYRDWVENLAWDWCISRQRHFGVPFPVWYCKECGEVNLAGENQLPVDPLVDQPLAACPCGSQSFIPEEDVMDTWATSSMTPQIVGRWLERNDGAHRGLYDQVFPFSLRPQAHEIIRTWAFYTLTKSLYHFDAIPWDEITISGWGLAPEGSGKISKSRGGGPVAPMQAIEEYSADAVRYWAASTGYGRDTRISEEKMRSGVRLMTKMWNVARFSEPFLLENLTALGDLDLELSSADRWILSRTQHLVQRVTRLLLSYEFAAAKSELEAYFWSDLADNYLEMAKQRLYGEAGPGQVAARAVLTHALLTLLKLFSPYFPHITEEIYQGLFIEIEPQVSIHCCSWPEADPRLIDSASDSFGAILVQIATSVRRYKSEHNLSLATELDRLRLTTRDSALSAWLQNAVADLSSVTRARHIEISKALEPGFEIICVLDGLSAAVKP